MAVILHKLKRNLTIVLTLIWCLSITRTTANQTTKKMCSDNPIIEGIVHSVTQPLENDNFVLADGITIKRDQDFVVIDPKYQSRMQSQNDSCADSVLDKVTQYARTHRVDVNLSKVFPMERSLQSAGK